MKKYKYFLLILSVTFLASCKKYLDEVNYSAEDAGSIFQSESGTESAIGACYVTLRMWYGKENSWDLTDVGTDLYTWGQDNRSRGFCTYESFNTSEEQSRVRAVWAELYSGLNTCNLVLKNIDGVDYKDSKLKITRKAEVSVLRAHYLWQLVEVWGNETMGPFLSTEPIEIPLHNMTRSSIDDFYKVILSDLDTAIACFTRVNAPITPSASNYGRITITIAEAFKARMLLTLASYKNDNALYSQSLALAKKFIDPAGPYSASYKLVPNWRDIWHITKIKNNEVIWPVNYSDKQPYTRSNLRYKNILTDGVNHIIVLKTSLDNKLTYYFLAAWEKEPGGISNESAFKNYLDDELTYLDNPLEIKY